MKISDLPKEIADLAVKRQIEQGNKENRENEVCNGKHIGGFEWGETPEKWSFWYNISEGRFAPFYEIYPQLPEFGEVIEVSNNGDWYNVIFYAYIKGEKFPVITTDDEGIKKQKEGSSFRVSCWLHFRRIPAVTEPETLEQRVERLEKELKEIKGKL